MEKEKSEIALLFGFIISLVFIFGIPIAFIKLGFGEGFVAASFFVTTVVFAGLSVHLPNFAVNKDSKAKVVHKLSEHRGQVSESVKMVCVMSERDRLKRSKLLNFWRWKSFNSFVLPHEYWFYFYDKKVLLSAEGYLAATHELRSYLYARTLQHKREAFDVLEKRLSSNPGPDHSDISCG